MLPVPPKPDDDVVASKSKQDHTNEAKPANAGKAIFLLLLLALVLYGFAVWLFFWVPYREALSATSIQSGR